MTKVALAGALRVNSPSRLVMIPLVVPFSNTFAPIIGSPLESVTTPFTVTLSCCVPATFSMLSPLLVRTISGVYSSETKKDADFQKACELTAEFAKKEGRQPRIMIAKMGQDGHDRGAKVVATGYADCGFDVDMGPLFQTPAEAARQAVENDVHVMGVSSLAAGHKTLVPQVIEELKKLGREDIVVIAGGVIPAQDYDFLYKAGVAAIFGPGTSVAKAACQILEILLDE